MVDLFKHAFMALVVLVMVGLPTTSVWAATETKTETKGGYTWTYAIIDGGARIGVSGESEYAQWECAVSPAPVGSVEIPSELGGYPVTGIGYCTFLDCFQMTSVTIPASVTTIMDYAFYNSGLTSVVIPSKVESIGSSAFGCCWNLGAFAVAEENANFKSVNGCLLTKDGKALVYAPSMESVQVPAGVESIKDYAFAYNYLLKAVELPESLVSIGTEAFFYCGGLTSVTIPASVTTIGYGGFYGCAQLATVTFEGDKTLIDIESDAFWGTPYKDSLPFRMIVEEAVLVGIEGVPPANLEIPSGVTRIGPNVFSSCSALESVTIPEGVTAIDYNAFYWCENLSRVSFPDSLRGIGGNAFATTALESITLPASLQEVNYSAFYDIPSLTAVYFKGNAPEMVADDIYGFSMNVTNYVREGSTGWKASGSTELPELWPDQGAENARPIRRWAGAPAITYTVTFDLGDHVFRTGGGALEQTVVGGDAATAPVVEAESGYEVRGWDREFDVVSEDMTVHALYSREGALADGHYTAEANGYTWSFTIAGGGATIELGNNVWGAAVSPSPKGAVEIPSELGGWPVTGIGYCAFCYCSQMTSVKIPASVQSIGMYAFVYTGLRTVVLPASVQSLGSYAFSDSLSSIFFEGNAPASVDPWTYAWTTDSLATFVRAGSTGWMMPTSEALPDAWPMPDAWGNGVSRSIQTWTTYPDPCYLVTFDLGDGATRTGGGELLQAVAEGAGAVAPTFQLNEGYEFYDWDAAFSAVSNSIVVHAQYRVGGKLSDGEGYTEEVDGYTWSFSVVDGEARIGRRDPWVKGECAVSPRPEGALAIPSELGGRPVTGIGINAFWHCPLMTSVTIPEGVVAIDDDAFWDCASLKRVVFEGDEEEIVFGYDVFAYTPYEDGWGVPYLDIEDNVVVGVTWEWEWDDCGCLTNGTLRIPEGVTAIADRAFEEVFDLESVEIPACVKTVGSYAFGWCVNLATVSFADRAGAEVAETAFNGTPWKLANEGWKLPFLENDDGVLAVRYETVHDAETMCAVTGGEVVIPEGVCEIPDRAFAEDCDVRIERIVGSTGLEGIGTEAFAGCPYLRQLTLRSTAVEVASDAFGDDADFVAGLAIILDAGDKLLGGWKLASSGETYPALGNEAFLVGPGDVATPVVKTAEVGAGQVSQFEMPDDMGGGTAVLAGVSNVDWGDFASCAYLGADEGGEVDSCYYLTYGGLTDAEKTAESDQDDSECYSLTALNIAYWGGWISRTSYPAVDDVADEFRDTGFPDVLDWVDANADDETSIYDNYEEGDFLCGGGAFQDFLVRNLGDGKGLVALTWNDYHAITCCGFVRDESKSLGDPGYLTGLFIVDSDNDMYNGEGGASAPNRVAYCPLVWNEEEDCYLLGNIYGYEYGYVYVLYSVRAKDAGIVESPFSLLTGGTTVVGFVGTIPEDLVIPDGITEIGESAFDRDFHSVARLKSVTLPSSVTTLDMYAFWGCVGLESVAIPSSVTEIVEDAFGSCNSLATVYVDKGDVDRVKALLEASGLDCANIAFVEREPTPQPQPQPQPQPRPQPRPQPQPQPEPAAALELHVGVSTIGGAETAPYADAAVVYDGYVRDADGGIVGTIQVKVAKGKIDKATGELAAKVSATAQMADGSKKISFKNGIADASGNVTGLTAAGHVLDLTLGVDGLDGSLDGMTIDGARNLFSAKDVASKSTAAAMERTWAGTVNIVTDEAVLSMNIAKKGKVKVTGTVNGVKTSAASQLLIGESDCCIPVVITKKARLSFNVWLTAKGDVEVVGLDGLTAAGKPGSLKAGAVFHMDGDKLAQALPGLYVKYLPDGLAVSASGTKWIVAGGAKAGKVTLNKAKDGIDEEALGVNPSGLKFSYKAKDGSFTGSFKASALEGGKIKSYSVSVAGVLVDGVGYGTATIKKVGGASVTIE